MTYLIKRLNPLGQWQYLTASSRDAKRLTPLWSIDARDAKLWKRLSAADKESLRHPGAIVIPAGE